MKDLGDLNFFLGIEVARSEEGIVLNQKKVLSQYMHSPKTSHMEVALRVVRYIKSNPGLGLFMLAEASNKLTAYCDSDWGSCLQTKRSVAGTKHIDIDCHFVRERISQKMIKTNHVPTEEQLANILTKALGKSQHEYLLSKPGMKNIFKPST
ncbi:putative primary amine oxidase-like [Capsicum annuum]|nr:putative primary amine oxidase-like [Capsicum annuum]